MTEQEAAVIVKDLLYLNRDSSRTEFIKALEMSIQALKNEARRKKVIDKYRNTYHNPEFNFVLNILKECEESEVEK